MVKFHRLQRVILSVILLFFLTAAVSSASTRIRQGRVTKSLWQEKYRHVEIDGDRYTLMPEAKIYRVDGTTSEGRKEEASQWRVLNGKKVEIWFQGRRIYTLYLVD